jgi:hypothetical protein
MIGEGGCWVSANEYSRAHRAQINFRDLSPYLVYGGGLHFLFPMQKAALEGTSAVDPDSTNPARKAFSWIRIRIQVLVFVTKINGLFQGLKNQKICPIGSRQPFRDKSSYINT